MDTHFTGNNELLHWRKATKQCWDQSQMVMQRHLSCYEGEEEAQAQADISHKHLYLS